MRLIPTMLMSLTMMESLGYAYAERPLLVAVPVKQIFAPAGFDDNDDAQVVVEGTFPNTCYKLAHTQVLKSEDGQSFEVIQMARKFSGVCIPTTVPFQSEVNLGPLPAGDYTISNQAAQPTTLTVVTAASANQDEHLYAPVSQVRVSRRNSSGYIATLTGTLPNGCFKQGATQLSRHGNVLVMLPLFEYDETLGCASDAMPLKLEIPLPDHLDAGKYLLHVRSMSGKAVNTVFFADGD